MSDISQLIEMRRRAQQIVEDFDDLIAEEFARQVDTDRFVHSVANLGDGFRVVDCELRYSAAWLGEKRSAS